MTMTATIAIAVSKAWEPAASRVSTLQPYVAEAMMLRSTSVDSSRVGIRAGRRSSSTASPVTNWLTGLSLRIVGSERRGF